MHIHFVCSGNAYRSRLAEAYGKSVLIGNDIRLSSSGIAAAEHKFGNGPICWYGMRLMKRNNLIPFMAWHERQTTRAILKDVDFLVCMKEEHLNYCKKLGYTGCVEVWNIADLNEMEGFIPGTVVGIETDMNHIRLTEETFRIIKNKVDSLLAQVAKDQR